MSQAPRIELLSRDAARKAAAEAELPEAMAELNIFRVLLRQPRVAREINNLLITLLFRGTLDARLRELVIMRIGWATGSVYEWTQHWRIAQEQFELSAEDLLAVRDWRSAGSFGPAERAVLAATDETLTSGRISPETFEECRAQLGGDAQLIELVAAIGCWRMVSQILRSIEIPLEDGIEPWPPDGALPESAGGSS